MNPILKTLFSAHGAWTSRRWKQAARQPQKTQAELLARLVRTNRDTDIGRAFGFKMAANVQAFRKSVPIMTYTDFAPRIDRMLHGAPRILTADPPVMFCLTSGTTDQPKHVPLTQIGLRHARQVSAQWLYHALRAHPDFMSGAVLCITGSPSEHRAPCGLPCGSVSGAIQRALPAPVRHLFALPALVADIENYALRNHCTARLALERDISFATTPNPTTLIAIADAGIKGQERIIRAIRDGIVVENDAFDVAGRDAERLAACARRLTPNPKRAQYLDAVLARHGALLPRHCWTARLIGCWLGGSIGFHAAKLGAYYERDTPLRDLGYLASEGSFTLPVSDHTAAGIPFLHGHVFEFAPETEGPLAPDTPTLLCHELEDGKRYRIIITNWNGLYRYDIGDIVEVQGQFENTPLLAFVRKERDQLNITGEKLHVNHLLLALQAVTGPVAACVRAVPDLDRAGYDILVLFASEPDRDSGRSVWLKSLDQALQTVNIEYAAKRKSGRLKPPRARIMDPAWPAAVRAAALATGRHDIQFKWQTMVPTLSDCDRAHIRKTITMEETA